MEAYHLWFPRFRSCKQLHLLISEWSMSTFSSLDMWANHPQSNSAPSQNSKSLLDRQRCLHISCHQYDAWNPSVFRSVIRLYSELGFHTFKGFLGAWQHGTFHNYRTPRCRLQCFFWSKLQEKQQECVSNKKNIIKISLTQNVSTIVIMLSAQNDSWPHLQYPQPVRIQLFYIIHVQLLRSQCKQNPTHIQNKGNTSVLKASTGFE